SCYLASLIEPFCETKVAHHRFAVFIKENVPRLKIAMQNSLAMRVSDAARDLRHQLHTLARLIAECRCSASKAPTRRIFHAEKRQPVHALAGFETGKNVRMIEARAGLDLAPKPRARLLG